MYGMMHLRQRDLLCLLILVMTLFSATPLPNSEAETQEVTLLDDGFESGDWDVNWDASFSYWYRSTYEHTGTQSAAARYGYDGAFTCDPLDASDATALHVEFWFTQYRTDAGDFSLYYWDGSSYVYVDDLTNNGGDYPVWARFSVDVTDSRFFVDDFRIRLVATLASDEDALLDDVLITKTVTQSPPSEVTLLDDSFESGDWDVNWDASFSYWYRSTYEHTGTQSAAARYGYDGAFTCDPLDASDATALHVEFWFTQYRTDAGDFSLYYWDGSSYVYVDDLTNNGGDYPVWARFSVDVTDSRFFVDDFRIRLVATLASDEDVMLDDVLITKMTSSTSNVLGVSNHDTNIEGGSGTNWEKTGENAFSFSLEWDVTTPNYAEKYWFMFKVNGNAGGKTVTYDVNVQNTIGSRTGYTPAVSFNNGETWSYIPQTDISYYGDTEPHVVFKVRFPSGQDTGLVAATIPLMYSQLQQYAEQFDSPYGYVTSYSSELGRNVYVFTVSEGTAANKHVIWVIAGQEPSEYWPQHIALGLIDYLISGAGATLRNEHIWKIVPSINPDGNYLGKSQRNGVGTDLTTEWGYAMTGQADAEIQGLVDKMMSLRSQGYAFDAFIDLHSLYTDDWIIFRSTSSSLFDNYYYQENLVNRIKSNTYWGMDGTIPFTSLQKTVGAIPNEFGCPTVMLEANQWRSNLIYGVPATLANLYDIGKDLGLALEGYMK